MESHESLAAALASAISAPAKLADRLATLESEVAELRHKAATSASPMGGQRLLEWVPLSRYCEASGESSECIRSRRRSGIWLEGVEWRRAGDKKIWINLKAVEKWASTSSSAPRRSA
ncbi:hypothetical protein [Craterilacuibacter sinensis]|uniref:Excisionase n=1 Tax=Craterilacuibacter sinensis TaxID=2686017 RepID=A0A845BXM7_9NEIS|nr:hypothetical protein [Craterilacuibacter sinensis]MXR37253.1 hypothetical protein [Craterilacuibacter sinensis]